MGQPRSLLFPLHGFIDWNGGIDLARVLSTAILHPAVTNRFNVSFALPTPTTAQGMVAAAMRYWRLRLAGGKGATDPGSPTALRRTAHEVASGHELIVCKAGGRGIVEAASSIHADIVFPTMLPLGRGSVARIGYLFDFQHRHMPELFSKQTIRNRNSRFARIANDANAVIVNSRFAANDATCFLQLPADRILTIPYTPHAHEWWFSVEPINARKRYGIASRYLMICNHFWKHKDHATALRAFALLREQRSDPSLELVMTGDPVDHRDPRHYNDLLHLAKQLGVTSSVHFLGLIPKRDQLALMRGCLALVQPTKFEGGPGGGAVYEAIGLGVPAVVSDIPVNLEINQGDVHFFRTGDADDLAEQMASVLDSPSLRPTQEALLARGNANLARLGNTICDYLVQVPAR